MWCHSRRRRRRFWRRRFDLGRHSQSPVDRTQNLRGTHAGSQVLPNSACISSDHTCLPSPLPLSHHRSPADTHTHTHTHVRQQTSPLNSTQPESTDAGVNISMSASLCSRFFKHNQLITTPDRFPVPVRSAVKSNLTNWCNWNLSNRALNVLAVLASTTVLGRLFQILTIRAEKECLRES